MRAERSEILHGVKFVYFDVGNVLFSFQGGLESLSKKLNVPLAKVSEYWRSKDDDICRGKLTPQEFWNNAKSKFGYSGQDMDFVSFWIDHFSKIEAGHELAYALSKDFQLGLLTNAYPNVINRVINTDLMPKVKWTNIVQSCDAGFVKPERELFELALEKSGFKYGEVLLIDDLLENCTNAQKAGWKSLQFIG